MRPAVPSLRHRVEPTGSFKEIIACCDTELLRHPAYEGFVGNEKDVAGVAS
jgi:hypothetical protein